MVATPVEAVWVWHYAGVNQKWTYGRYGNESGFTKDHLQIKDAAGAIVSAVYGVRPEKDQKHEVTLTWPGGTATGRFSWSSGRFTLRWDRDKTSTSIPWSAPAPWRMTPNPDDSSPSPLRGNGSATDDVDALAAIGEFNASGTRAYLVAVKLKGDDDALHVRTYIDQPDDDLGFADTSLLPGPIRGLVSKLGAKPTCEAVSLDSSGSLAEPEVLELIGRLEDNPNLLLIGPPGTGKSVLLDKLARHVADPGRGVFFDPDKLYDAWTEPRDSSTPGKAITVVLHPSYSYDNLVVGLLPKADSTNGGISVDATTGPLVNLARYASAGDTRALLVLDEFNRGNAAAILGDTLALLDKDKRGSAYVDLPTYGLQLNVPDEFAVDGDTEVHPRFTLPKNLWIVAAMNSSDRSVAPLDAALRRRFSIIELGPDYDTLGYQLDADDDADLEAAWSEWTPGFVAKLAVNLLEGLNNRIEAALGRDFTLGHSNLWHVGGDTAERALRSLAAAWDERIVQTLRLALQDDDETLAFILKAGKSTEAVSVSPARAVWWKKADSTYEQFARPRLQFESLTEVDDAEQLHRELKRLAGA